MLYVWRCPKSFETMIYSTICELLHSVHLAEMGKILCGIVTSIFLFQIVFGFPKFEALRWFFALLNCSNIYRLQKSFFTQLDPSNLSTSIPKEIHFVNSFTLILIISLSKIYFSPNLLMNKSKPLNSVQLTFHCESCLSDLSPQ